MDQPPSVAFTAFADAWPRAIETEIGAALFAIGRRKDFDFLNGKLAISSRSDHQLGSSLFTEY